LAACLLSAQVLLTSCKSELTLVIFLLRLRGKGSRAHGDGDLALQRVAHSDVFVSAVVSAPFADRHFPCRDNALQLGVDADGVGIIEAVSFDHLAAGSDLVFAKCVDGCQQQVPVRTPAVVSESPGSSAECFNRITARHPEQLNRSDVLGDVVGQRVYRFVDLILEHLRVLP